MEIIERDKPQRGDVYRHFKGKTYIIISSGAKNCTHGADADKEFVIYYADDDLNKVYIREQSEFLSPVDREKYPDVKQEWRFEKDKMERRNLWL